MSVTNGSFDAYKDSRSNRVFYRGRIVNNSEFGERGVGFKDLSGQERFVPLDAINFLGYLPAKTRDGIPRDFVDVLQTISDSGANAFFGWSPDGIDAERYVLMKFDNNF